MKFEKGKKVRVTVNSNYKGYKIGDIVTMKKPFIYLNNGSKGFYCDYGKEILFSDCEEIEEDTVKPTHYKTREVNGMDVIDLVKHWQLNFNEGCILKYLLRDKGQDIEDLEKIIDYAQRELKHLRNL